MKLKIKLFFGIIFCLLCSNLLFAVNDTTIQNNQENQKTIEKYNNYAHNTYLILLSILSIGIAITLFLIAEHYGKQHIIRTIMILLFAAIMAYLIL